MSATRQGALAPTSREAARRARERKRPGPGKTIVWLALALLACVCVYPLLFVISTTFKSNADYTKSSIAPPLHPTFQNIRDAWEQADVGSFAAHSLIAVTAAVILITVLACPAGFALAHMRLPFRGVGLLVVIGMMMLPSSVLMVPLFRIVQELGLLNQYAGLVFVYASLNLPFSIYLMSSYFRRVPSQLLESAEIDGAGPIKAFAVIALPLARPGILTLVTLNFLWLWNELLYALLILQDPTKRTLMVGLALLNGEHTTAIPLISAGLFLALIPPLVVFALFQRNLAEGLTAGALK